MMTVSNFLRIQNTRGKSKIDMSKNKKRMTGLKGFEKSSLAFFIFLSDGTLNAQKTCDESLWNNIALFHCKDECKNQCTLIASQKPFTQEQCCSGRTDLISTCTCQSCCMDMCEAFKRDGQLC